ncbi:hypothetical protein CR513_38942, partial [Mucuna pruriens]
MIPLHRPRHHGNPRADSLHHGVGAAMRDECSDGWVVEDKQLWSPAPDNHPLVLVPLLKALGKPLLLLFLALTNLPFLLGNHPYEVVTRRFHPGCNLVQLFIRELAHAPEARVHHRLVWPGVKPSEALVHVHRALLAPLCSLLSGSVYEGGRANMPSFSTHDFVEVLDVLFSVKFGEAVHDEAIAFAQRLHHGAQEHCQLLRRRCFDGDGVRETRNDKRVGRIEGVWGGVVCGAGAEEEEGVEGQFRDTELGDQIVDPREQTVGEDAIGWVLLHETFDGATEHVGDPVELVEVGDGGDVFEAVQEAHLFGGELHGVEAEERVGGDRFGQDLGRGRGGDDGRVVAARGEQCRYFAERDHVTC